MYTFNIKEICSYNINPSKKQILNHLYNAVDDEPELKIIDVFICKLRKKIEKYTNGEQYIKTIWGSGYKLSDE